MPAGWTPQMRTPLPLILIRGFGGNKVDDERMLAYQGFVDGSVYPHKRGENYIYEGFILRLIKSRWRYEDGTNVINYYSKPIKEAVPKDAISGLGLPKDFFSGHKIVVDPDMARSFLLKPRKDRRSTFWVFRYYDLEETDFEGYGAALHRLVGLVQGLVDAKQIRPAQGNVGASPRVADDDSDDKSVAKPSKVNIIAHSMGGLIVRQAVQVNFGGPKADAAINKVVTLGTPHKGISFQLLRELGWLRIRAADELWQFNPKNQLKKGNPCGFGTFPQAFPLERLLCVVGTDFRGYSIKISTLANRIFSVPGEDALLTYNRSDGLVQQTYAVIDGSPRTYVNKCHGGGDSLMTARESFEIATRFFFGDVRVRLYLVNAKVNRRFDRIGRNEFFFGVSIKPRRLDFELFHQSKQAENCYGPFRKDDLSDAKPTFDWAGPNRMIWEGCLDKGQRHDNPDLVLRAEIYVGERDSFGFGFSDNIVFHHQIYVRALFEPFRLEIHKDEEFQKDSASPQDGSAMREANGGWEFDVSDPNFGATLRVEFDDIPEIGPPIRITPAMINQPTPKPAKQPVLTGAGK
ncbi:MAG: hypothetical protein ABTQ27_07945 [Amaricoccus sp.]|uniref:esterase/lipase family protein n=1 Tax=Amaricoccus sp. TaxID=1872485 RepID=UPI00331480F9